MVGVELSQGLLRASPAAMMMATGPLLHVWPTLLWCRWGLAPEGGWIDSLLCCVEALLQGDEAVICAIWHMPNWYREACSVSRMP